MKGSMKPLLRGIIIAVLAGVAGCGKSPKMPASVMEGFKVHPVSKTVTVKEIADLKDKELEQTIVDNIIIDLQDDGAGVTKEKIASLNQGQRSVYVTWILQAKIFKGGLEYYHNSTSGTISSFMIESLHTLGADKYAELVEKSNAVAESIKAGKVKVNDFPFADLDDAYDMLLSTESLDIIKVRYIRSHPEEFLHE